MDPDTHNNRPPPPHALSTAKFHSNPEEAIRNVRTAMAHTILIRNTAHDLAMKIGMDDFPCLEDARGLHYMKELAAIADLMQDLIKEFELGDAAGVAYREWADKDAQTSLMELTTRDALRARDEVDSAGLPRWAEEWTGLGAFLASRGVKTGEKAAHVEQ